MKTRAAVCHQAGQPLVIETVDLDGPKAGEVLVEIKATGICHTDEFTRSGGDPEGLFPVIFGHEGAGIVVDVGAGVKSVRKGDHVIPLYTPECRECKSCTSHKTNLCTAIRTTQGQGVMPDGTSRFSLGREKIHHYMGCSTFSNFTVLPEIAVAKVREDAPFDKICYIGCGVTTGIGAVINTAKVEPGANVVVFGLGGIGLNVIQGARMAGANMIVGVDLNPARKPLAEQFGMTHFVNPKEVQGDLVPYLVSLTGGGAEIFRKEVRSQIAKGKESAEEYLDVHRTWHQMGGRSTCTMLYGHVESLADRVDHLRQLRALQDETHGFTGFVALPFQPEGNRIPVRQAPTGFDQLRTVAISRIYLDNVDHIQSSWVTQGMKIGQVALGFGADDLGSVMIEENVVSAAGTTHRATTDDFVRAIRALGKTPVQRDTLYREVKVWN